MRTIIIQNIKLIFDTDRNDDNIDQSLELISFLNGVLEKLNFPEFPQIIAIKDEIEVKEKVWEE